MLAAVVKKKTGENVKDYLTPRLFEKIGINAERFVWLKWPNGIDAEPATFATTEDILNGAVDLISAKQEAETGDIVIVTAGIPSPNFKQTKAGVSNMMRIAVID